MKSGQRVTAAHNKLFGRWSGGRQLIPGDDPAVSGANSHCLTPAGPACGPEASADIRLVAVWVLPGATGNLAAFTKIVEVVRGRFKLTRMVMAGTRPQARRPARPPPSCP